MRWKAFVRGVTGKTRHLLHGREAEGNLAAGTAWLVIEPVDGNFFLYRFGADGACLADTWHLNVDEAKRQARSEFDHADWHELP